MMVKNYSLILGQSSGGFNFLFDRNGVYCDVGDYAVVEYKGTPTLVRVVSKVDVTAEEGLCYEEEIKGKVIMTVYGLSEKLQKGAGNE